MLAKPGWVDDVATDYAIDYLREHVKKNPRQPFDMVLGFKSPHDPRTPPPRAQDRFKGETFLPVPNLAVHSPFPPGKLYNDGAKPTSAKALDQFRCISSADDCLGRLLDALDELKLADKTVVIFASDNGYYFGEHHLNDKRSAYPESIRIPLLLRYPRLAAKGKVVQDMVLNIDLPSTLLDLAGLPASPSMQGRSWRPLLSESKPADWRDAFFYESFYERGYPVPTTTAVRTERAKLIKYDGHPEWTELYDLSSDPYEMRNLARDLAATKLLTKMEAEYARQASLVRFQIPPDADVPATAPASTQGRKGNDQ